QLPSPAVYEGRQPDARRPAVIEDLDQRGAYRAPGEEHVVDQYEVPPVDVERNVGAPRVAVQAAPVVVVAIVGDVERAESGGGPESLMKPLRDPHAAGMDADQAGFRPHRGPQLLDERLQQLLGVGAGFAGHGDWGARVSQTPRDEERGTRKKHHSTPDPLPSYFTSAKYASSIRCAATASVAAFSRGPRAPAWRSACSASRDVRRSSTNAVSTPKRPCSRCAKRRASCATGCGEPSACAGNPTTNRTGRHSATRRSMAAKRRRFSVCSMVVSGCARRVSKSPVATPMRLVPKSNARTVPVLAEC